MRWKLFMAVVTGLVAAALATALLDDATRLQQVAGALCGFFGRLLLPDPR